MTRTIRKRDEPVQEPDDATAVAPPAPSPVPLTPAWASAVGNQRVARMAAEHAEEEATTAVAAEPADEDADLLAGLDEVLPVVDAEPETEAAGAEAAGVATLRRSALARRPKAPAAPRKVPLTHDDVADLKRVGTRTIRALAALEQERAITTAEAEQIRERIEGHIARAKAGRGNRRGLPEYLQRLRRLPESARKRAAAGRSTKGKRAVSDFIVEPPVIRVNEHEAARIAFVVKGTPKSVSAFILKDPGREGTSYRFFNIDATPGYHQVIWDGTFEGSRNRPPDPGVYRIQISVTGEDGRTEELFDQIRVENPDAETVLPRVGSGREISTLTFDGRTLILTDDALDTIEVPATSGLKPNNPKNKEKEDYTLPEHQWVQGKGPIPAGTYFLKPGQYQLPNADQRGTKYASGGSAAKWGPMRVQILPNQVKNRSEFFLHMDVTNDGTAGCIGVPPPEVGKFNQIMSLIATSKKDVKLVVSY